MAAPTISSAGKLLSSVEAGHVANADNQGDTRQQLANLTDLVRQVVGDAVVAAWRWRPSRSAERHV